MPSTNPDFRVRISKSLNDELQNFISDNGLDKVSFLKLAIEAVKRNTDIELTDEEQDIVNQAVEQSGLDYSTILKTGLLAECKKLNTQAKSRENFESMDEETLKRTTVKGAAFYRIDKAVQEVMKHNNGCQDKDDKFFITSTLIFKLTGSNRKTINDYFEANKNIIDEHNASHDLSVTDNRGSKGNPKDPKYVLGF